MSQSVTRREVIAGAAAFGAAPSLALGATRKPDILFIMADDLGYADVSCYGRTDYQTPNVDRLAAQGTRFMQAYANSAVCSPTRVALITGRYQGRIPVGLDEPGGLDVGLEPDHPTLPSLLKKQGYRTALIGKWHMGGLPNFGPLKSGYDHFYGVRSGGADYFRHDDELWNEDILAHESGYLTTLLGNNALAKLQEFTASPEPFLMSLHFTAPHFPWEGPSDTDEADRLAKAKAGLVDLDGGSQRSFQEMVVAMDQEIGRVLDALEKSGRADNTIVVFTSDNGGERFSNTWPFVGKKTELLEGGIRVPAIVRWPAQVAAGKQSDQVIMSMDWLPTLIAAAGGRPDRHFPSDGINFLPQVVRGKANIKRKLFWRYYSMGQEAVRDGDFKYLKILGNSFLFNIVEDPLERANLKKRHPDVFDRLAADWQAWNKTMLPYTAENSSWTFSGEYLADHFGAPGPVRPKPSPDPTQ